MASDESASAAAVSVVLGNWCEYDVTRKGDRFLMLQRADQIDSGVAVVPALHLVENWFQEFAGNTLSK